MIVTGWTIDRGRSYELDKNSVGQATISIVDTTGEADPESGSYAFNPGTPAAITLRNAVTGTESTVFRGFVERMEYRLYPTMSYAEATLHLRDGLDKLARMEMYAAQGHILEWGDYAFVSGAQDGDVWFDEDDQVAHRINQVLDQAQWPTGLREVFSGNVRLQDTVYAYRTPALTAILDAADAEFPGVANFYVQKDGRATFHGRLARFNPDDTQYHITTWRCGDLAAVNSDSTRALIFSLEYDRDSGKLINSALITPKGIADADIEGQRYEDSASITQHGSRSISYDNLLTLEDHFDGADANAATLKMAEYYVENYKAPRTRVNRISFRGLPSGSTYGAREWALLCGVDISDVIRLQTSRVAGDFFVEGVHYRATNRGTSDFTDVELDLDVSPRAYFNTNPWV